jgi:broad specificity phosphatase PhoE
VIALVRHGETDDNVPPLRVQGTRDTPLNATGRRQASELAERVAAAPPAALYSSQLARARETAEIVGLAVGIEPVVDSRFAEGDRGRWEGKLFAEVEREDPDGWASWQRGGETWRFPGGESLREQSERVLAGLADVRAGALPALVVCHGGSIRVALCHFRGTGLDAFHSWTVPNVAVFPL